MLFRAAQTLGLAFLFVPISTIAFANVPRELNGDATALFVMLRNVFGSIGISVASAMILRRSQVHQAYLSQWASSVSISPSTRLSKPTSARFSRWGARRAPRMRRRSAGSIKSIRTRPQRSPIPTCFSLRASFPSWWCRSASAALAPQGRRRAGRGALSMRKSTRRFARKAAIIALIATLCGCSVGPDFTPPDPHLPQKSFFGPPEPAVPEPERPPSPRR